MSRKAFLLPLARLLMSSLFIWDGIGQLRDPGGTAQYFASVHVPAPDIAVWISIPVHLLGGLALLAGFYSRWAAALLALVCLGTAFGVHLPAGDQNNMIHFYKNLDTAAFMIPDRSDLHPVNRAQTNRCRANAELGVRIHSPTARVVEAEKHTASVF